MIDQRKERRACRKWLQAKYRRQARGPVAVLPILVLAAGLGGCGADSGADTPLRWWHELQGGEIAADRPPPPGVGDPYPKLGTVPARPAESDPAVRAALAARLAAVRDRAERNAARTPIEPYVPPPPPAAPPPAAGAPPAAAAPSAGAQPAAPAPGAVPPEAGQGSVGAASATLSAAEAPPKPSKAPPAPAAAPAGTAATEPAIGPEPGAPLVIAGGLASGPVPEIPPAPPSPASFEGVATQPAPTPVPPLPVLPGPPPGATLLRFPAGSAVLPSEQSRTLHHLASGHGVFVVIGYGDSASDMPAAQLAALDLGLRRAEAVAAALTASGVPPEAIRVEAKAIGRGAAVRLVH